MRVTLLVLTLSTFGAFGIACSSTTVTNSASDAGTTPGEDGGATEDAGTTPEASAPFALTSSVLTEGATMNAAQTCNGADQSPDLAWGPGPEGTKSYAIVLNDQTLDFLHSIIYDIPASVTSIPGAVDRAFEPTKVPGAKQNESFRRGRFGYAGPCPPKPNEDTYELVLYALKVDKLSGLTNKSTLADTLAELEKQKLATTKLTGKYKQP
ncbi:MAG: YbhB/YbcL family Raf kinase inhibitor-like protein [Deltaproteobacteria bacterium]|nr:YbhB/YbcL family Raf kinase inhibitor-like protein [Deltaproteobacteria bacterium]